MRNRAAAALLPRAGPARTAGNGMKTVRSGAGLHVLRLLCRLPAFRLRARRLELYGAQTAAQDEVAQYTVVHKRRLDLLCVQLGAHRAGFRAVKPFGALNVSGVLGQCFGQQRSAGDRPAYALEGGGADEARRFADEERVVVP